jgi:hypothetical protein
MSDKALSTVIDLRCYETFCNGYLAFEYQGQPCFGPASRLAAFLSGSTESFLVGDAALTKIDECHAQQRSTRSNPQVAKDNDGLSQTRKRWESEKTSCPTANFTQPAG